MTAGTETVVDSPATDAPATPRRAGLSVRRVLQLVEWAAAIAAAGLALATLWRLIHTADRGLDFTVEGMYLLSADARSRTASFNNAFGR